MIEWKNKVNRFALKVGESKIDNGKVAKGTCRGSSALVLGLAGFLTEFVTCSAPPKGDI